MSQTKTWFSDWFNTKYYHTLYKHRDDKEAQLFMRNLTTFLQLPKSNTILDLACGKGRHSVYLNSLGYDVIGADLSENSIEHANQFANDHLKFLVQDMRTPFNFQVDAVFNMFTSFGYFDDDQEDINILNNVKNLIKEEGVFVLDYMNVTKVVANLVTKETISRDGIDFHITRNVENGFIVKRISFTDNNENYEFQERVKCLDIRKFEAFCKEVGLKIDNTFGNYALEDYNPETSDRLILVLRK